MTAPVDAPLCVMAVVPPVCSVPPIWMVPRSVPPTVFAAVST